MLMRISAIAVVLALILGGGGATLVAANNSLPEQGLYPLKLAVEDMQLQTSDPIGKVEMALLRVENRVNEVVRLRQQGNDIPESLMVRLQNQLEETLQLAAQLGNDDMTQAVEQIRQRLETQERKMAQLCQEAGQCQEGSLLRIREMIQERLRLCEEGLQEPEQLRIRLQERQQLQEQENKPEESQPGPGPQEPGSNGPGPQEPGQYGPGPAPQGTAEPKQYGPGSGPEVIQTSEPEALSSPDDCDNCSPALDGTGPGPGPGPMESPPGPNTEGGYGPGEPEEPCTPPQDGTGDGPGPGAGPGEPSDTANPPQDGTGEGPGPAPEAGSGPGTGGNSGKP